jgi:hypothetical protein
VARRVLEASYGQAVGLDGGSDGGSGGGLDLTAYQNDDGGLALLPYGDSDLALSARVADLIPDQVGRQPLARYFRAVVDDPEATRERAAVALQGLAAVGAPVLADVQALATADDLGWRERLHAGLAASALGDLDTAGALYRAALAADGERRGGAVRLNVGADQDDVLEATSLAATLGARLADALAPALFNYVLANAPTDNPVDVDKAAYLALAVPLTPAQAVEASYNLAGERQTVTLEPGETRTVQLPAGALEDLDLKAEVGQLGVTAATLAPLAVRSAGLDPELSLQRSYAEKGDPAEIGEADLVKVQLDYTLGDKAVDGCYEVTDLLPSGLYPVTRPWERGISDPNVAWPYKVDGQRVSFCVTKDGPPSPITYYARVVGPGDFTAEPALLQSSRAPESLTVTEPLGVTVR